MTTRITIEELVQRLQKPGARPEDVGEYFKVDEPHSSPLSPRIVVDEAKVDLGATPAARERAALAIPGFNTVVRAMRNARFQLMLAGGYKGPIIVAEGDSWFTYPRLDIVGELNDRYAIAHLAGAGDTLQQMLDQDEYLAETQRVRASILLLSGGGNDALGGGDLKTHLRPFDPSLSPALHIRSSYAALMDGAIARFDQIYRRVGREAPGVAVIVHGYDYAIPADGPWLGRPMKEAGIPDPEFQRLIVRELIDRFAAAMARLAARYPHVAFLDNRGAVGVGEWKDELHPSPDGFRKVAALFDAAIKAVPVKARRSIAPADPRRKPRLSLRAGNRSPTGLNRGLALHLGLNKVDAGHYGSEAPLSGCHNDARAMGDLAASAGYEPLGTLLDDKATAKALTTAVRAAAKQLKTGDIFLLTYAGHGSKIPDFNGDDIEDGQDETLCLFDRQFLDDELYDLWKEFDEGVRVLMVSDSCHSGTIIRATVDGLARVDAAEVRSGPRPRTLPDNLRRDVISRHRAFYRKIAATTSRADHGGGLQPKRPRAVADPLRCSVRLLSGCQDNQVSADGDLNGLFTSRLLLVLERGFSGDYRAFHRAIRKLMPADQTPNHWTVGRKDPAFEGQQPFEI